MAAPLQTRKAAVNLAAAKGVPGSRIRRDPPPVAKKTVIPDRNEQDRRQVPIAIVAFTLALVVAIVGLASYGGWSPRQVTLEVNDRSAY
jgi:hypothetical protein